MSEVFRRIQALEAAVEELRKEHGSLHRRLKSLANENNRIRARIPGGRLFTRGTQLHLPAPPRMLVELREAGARLRW